MPEGPEIRRSTDALAKVLKGQVVRSISFGQPHLSKWQRLLRHDKVVNVEPRGKAVLTHFEQGHTIYSHNQLYGEWAIFGLGDEPATHKLRRIVITTDAHKAVLYSASDIEVLKSDQVHAHPYVAKLGVELLDPAMKQVDVTAVLDYARWQKKQLAQILLDQSFLAGVGNYLRSEILFVAGLHPWVRLQELNIGDKRRLAKAALRVTRQAYQTAGITNDLRLAKRLKAAGTEFDSYRHYVFDRDGQLCWVCHTPVVREMVSGRQLYWCCRCQPLTGSSNVI
jgi:endonuclease VIII